MSKAEAKIEAVELESGTIYEVSVGRDVVGSHADEDDAKRHAAELNGEKVEAVDAVWSGALDESREGVPGDDAPRNADED